MSLAKLLDRLAAGVLEGRLQDQVLRRIAGDEQLGQHEEIGAAGRGLGPRRARLLQVAVDVADDRIELGDGDPDGIGQGCCHAARFSAARRGGAISALPHVLLQELQRPLAGELGAVARCRPALPSRLKAWPAPDR